MLLAGAGTDVEEIAERTGFSRNAVYRWRWRHRHESRAVDGLEDEQRAGGPVGLPQKKAREILRRTVHEIPHEATHWSLRLMAKYAGVSMHEVRRMWEAADLKPHWIKNFKSSTGPDFAGKVLGVVGLYIRPPDNAVVLSVDEKTQIQALDRTQPLLPVRPGQSERRTNDYTRHGTRSLYAAFDIASGKV